MKINQKSGMPIDIYISIHDLFSNLAYEFFYKKNENLWKVILNPIVSHNRFYELYC